MRHYTHHTDYALLKMLRHDDALAFETIYRRYAAELNRFVFRKTGSRHDGEEIVQEIFTWLWINRQSLENISQLRTYLFQAAKNRVLNYFRNEKVRDRYAREFTAFRERYAPPDANLELSELGDLIERRLTELPERCQTAFRLSRMQHMPISGIAEKMAISHRTVENYIAQALRHLRREVKVD